MSYLRKYNTATSLYTELQQYGTGLLMPNPTLAAGDVMVSKDGGAWANIEGVGVFADFVDVAPAAGTQVRIRPGAANLSCATLKIRLKDATSPPEWYDRVITVETFGHASAQYQVDLTDGVRLGLTALPNAVAAGVAGLPVNDATGLVPAKVFDYEVDLSPSDAITGSIALEGLATIDGLLDEVLTTHITADSVAETLRDAAGVLAAFTAAGTNVTLVSPSGAGGEIDLIRGDDYYLAEGRSITILTLGAVPDLTTAVVTWTDGATTVTATKVDEGTSVQTAYIELSHTQTAAMTVGVRDYKTIVTTAGGHVLTEILGTLSVT